MADLPTPRFQPAPSVMLVSVDGALHELVRAAFQPIPILRVGHPRAACERMLATRPLAIVLALRPSADDLARVTEIAGAIGAELVIADDYPELDLLQERLSMAMVAMQRRRGRRA